MIVLYAEDDPEDFEIFCDVLKEINPSVKCIHAKDGMAALEFLENSIILPDYIFLDINMPAMDGKSCLKHLKKDKRLNPIPVVIYTTSKNQHDVEMCKQLGAYDYIVKGNSFKESVDRISTVL
jgi:CheY-like chemotaxis protein